MREHGGDFSFLVFTFHFSNYIPSRPQWSCTSCRAHRHRMSVPGRLWGQLEMNINLLGLENKSFMVRKISNVNLSLNSEGDEWRSRRSGTWKKKPFSRIWGNGRLILTNHSGSQVGWGGLHTEQQSGRLLLLSPSTLRLLPSPWVCLKGGHISENSSVESLVPSAFHLRDYISSFQNSAILKATKLEG